MRANSKKILSDTGLLICYTLSLILMFSISVSVQAQDSPRVWEAPLSIPTYELGPPNPYPALLDWQRRKWRPVYPYPFLDSLTTESLQTDLLLNGEPVGQTIGSALRRVTYHYWYHIGEIQAIRQMLGHPNLPEYVGDIETEAPYRPE